MPYNFSFDKKKSDLDLRNDSKAKCKMINSWNPFNAVWRIAADLQPRRFKGHKTPLKNCGKKVKCKGLRSGSLGRYVKGSCY